MKRYLITTKINSPFYTKWFEYKNHFNLLSEMIVYDLVKDLYTKDGKKWEEINEDHL